MLELINSLNYSKTLYIILSVYSIVTILTESSLFLPFRNFLTFMRKYFIQLETKPYRIIISIFGLLLFSFMETLFSCVLCMSVWVSYFTSRYFLNVYGFYNNFYDAMYLTAMVWFIHVMEEKITGK